MERPSVQVGRPMATISCTRCATGRHTRLTHARPAHYSSVRVVTPLCVVSAARKGASGRLVGARRLVAGHEDTYDRRRLVALLVDQHGELVRFEQNRPE